MLCDQQQHQLRYIVVAATGLRATRLAGATNVLSFGQSAGCQRLFGPETGEFDVMPVVAAACVRARATHRRMCGEIGRLVSSALYYVLGRQPNGGRCGVWCTVEHHTKLYAIAEKTAG